MKADQSLEELHRKWVSTGDTSAEVAYLHEAFRQNKFNGITKDDIFRFFHKLIQAGLKPENISKIANSANETLFANICKLLNNSDTDEYEVRHVNEGRTDMVIDFSDFLDDDSDPPS